MRALAAAMALTILIAGCAAAPAASPAAEASGPAAVTTTEPPQRATAEPRAATQEPARTAATPKRTIAPTGSAGPRFALGTTRAVPSTFERCATKPGEECIDVQVSCPRLNDTHATLRISRGTAGTAVLTIGGPGPGWYRGAQSDPNLSRAETAMEHNSRFMDDLLADGFRLVEVNWTGSSAWDQPNSLRRTPDNRDPSPAVGAITLACRPATVIHFAYQHYHGAGPFIAQGNSSGNSQIAMGLVYYGLGDILDVANLGAGPPPCVIHWEELDRDGKRARFTNGNEQETQCMVHRGAGKWDPRREPLFSRKGEVAFPRTVVNVDRRMQCMA